MKIFKMIRSLTAALVLALVLCMLPHCPVTASEDIDYTGENTESGYIIRIEDRADLLTAEEVRTLARDMMPLTQYGSVLFLTVDTNPVGSTSSLARQYFHETLGMGVENGVLFVIDMDYRQIYIFSDGVIYDVIGNSYADTITDNIYTYASAAEYYECASRAYDQIYRVMNGQKIAQPMKYIGNALIAIMIAMLLCFGIIMAASGLKQAKDAELLAKAHMQFALRNVTETKTHTSKRYSPVEHSSGGSSGGGGGGGGGGGSSGGGGGHGF